MISEPMRIHAIRAQVFRYPIDTPVQTSFGVMHDRPAVFVEIEDEDGLTGLGEIWCNFPACGAEHRRRLVDTVFAPLLGQLGPVSVPAIFTELTERTAVLAIQSGEHGPIAQCIAGIDVALWDLAAKRAREPLWRYLGGTNPTVGVYASGLNPDQPEVLAAARQREGYRAFKLKIGFGIERDLGNLAALRGALGADAKLMVDANQAWTLEQARLLVPRLEPFGLDWIEEPLRADRPWAEWASLADDCRHIRLAAGENIAGQSGFDEAIASRALGVVQPDLAKWGGISGCLPVARAVLAAGLRYCPHFLGGGIGLLASAHLLAAVGGDGMLEIDANPNPLRTLLCGPLARVDDGRCKLTDAAGLGPGNDALISPELRACRVD